MSDPTSSRLSFPSSDSLALNFTLAKFHCFDVEYTKHGEDVIYHYWPPSGETDFLPEFDTLLERAYREVMPADSDVRADFISKAEAALKGISRSDMADSLWVPLPTYWVRVVGWASRPGSDLFLLSLLFDRLNTYLEKAHAGHPFLQQREGSDRVSARDRGGKRQRGHGSRR